RAQRLQQREVFVPLQHDPGHAQVDFGEALAEIAGVERKIHFFAMELPHSDACFVRAYPEETAEAFCDGHNAAFGFFAKVPRSIRYDSTRLAAARTLGWRWRASWAAGCVSARGYSASCSRITCLPIGLAGPAKATTKVRSRDWSAGSVATCWFRCRGRPAWRR